MRTRAGIVGAIAIVLLLHVPAEVHARFGKSSHAGGGHGRSSSYGGSAGHSSYGHASTHAMGHSSSHSYGFWFPAPRYPGWGYRAYGPPLVMLTPPVADNHALAPDPNIDRPTIESTLSTAVTFASSATMLGAQLLIEGTVVGGSLGYTGVFSPAADGSGGDDAFHLFDAHVTYALASGERGRLRAELGANVAVAPEVTFVAPGIGISGTLGLGAGFGLNARVFGNVWPYTEVDASAGLLWATDAVALLAGARALYLDDNGALGAANAGDTSDFFYGPYAGLAFAL